MVQCTRCNSNLYQGQFKSVPGAIQCKASILSAIHMLLCLSENVALLASLPVRASTFLFPPIYCNLHYCSSCASLHYTAAIYCSAMQFGSNHCIAVTALQPIALWSHMLHSAHQSTATPTAQAAQLVGIVLQQTKCCTVHCNVVLATAYLHCIAIHCAAICCTVHCNFVEQQHFLALCCSNTLHSGEQFSAAHLFLHAHLFSQPRTTHLRCTPLSFLITMMKMWIIMPGP